MHESRNSALFLTSGGLGSSGAQLPSRSHSSCRRPRTAAAAVAARRGVAASSSAAQSSPPPPPPPPRATVGSIPAVVRRLAAEAARVLELTRPGAPPAAPVASAPARFEALPAAVRTPAQMLGRLSPGCEGTHGVFPRCNFACRPCYHSRDANHVRVDGPHTATEVARQLALLRDLRGPVGHCQLIGGEVSLLSPEDHAAALEIMRFYGRIPMSFTHGDFDYAYLKRLAVRADGKPRFARIDFAVHFDMYMYGRTGIERPACEADLAPYRRRFVEMFKRIKREHGVKYYLAHNMTVQDGNLAQIADVVREIKNLGFRMVSFQPAAQQGDPSRWLGDFKGVAHNDGEPVWQQIERGAGTRLPYKLFQMGDLRCNRTVLCGLVGSTNESDCPVVPFFDDACSRDERLRDVVMQQFGNVVLEPPMLALKVLRFAVTKFWLLPIFLGWTLRFTRRAGGIIRVLRYGVRPITFVMHRFMDSENVTRAWAMMEAGVRADDARASYAGPQVQETIERLSACSYGMAQVEQGRVVPACVQHSVYDPDENLALRKELPLGEPGRPPSDFGLALEV